MAARKVSTGARALTQKVTLKKGAVSLPMDPGMEELRSTIQSAGWKSVVAPTCGKELQAALDKLTAPKRPEGESDDYLRGRIAACRDFLTMFERGIKQYDAQRAAASLALEQEQTQEPEAVGSIYDPAADPHGEQE